MNSTSKRKLIIMGGLLASLCVWGCSVKNDSKKKTVEKVCSELFMYPSENAEKLLGKVLEAAEMESILGEIYKEHFTDEGYENFCNNRLPLKTQMAAKEKECSIKLKKLSEESAATELDNTYKYVATITLNEFQVEQQILVTFEGDKISYFNFGNNKLQKEITKL